jgi:pyruvate dehydrogenase E2 component (dihydrolipoamide acetyltransferase)
MSAKGAVETIEPTAAQRTAARRVAEAKATIPDFQASIFYDNAPSLGAAVVAAGRALKQVAALNGAYADAKFQHYENANVGVAIAGATPVVLDADTKTADDAQAEVDAARAALEAGTLTAAASANATFTLSHLADDGIDAYTSIIVPGHAGTLAIGARAATLSADARIVTPQDAAAFLKALVAALDGATAV